MERFRKQVESLESLARILVPEVVVRGSGGALWIIRSADTWKLWHFPAFVAIITLGMELLASIVLFTGKMKQSWLIPARGKHLDEFDARDTLYITTNKGLTSLFTYHMLRYCCQSQFVKPLDQLTLGNTLGALVALYFIYDFFYTLFHMSLHHRSIYRFIHKHHHRQKAPSRGNLDAINVHPFEFVSGEYNHMLAMYLVTKYVTPVHIVTFWVFVVFSGFLASLNHTRYDIKSPIISALYQVKYHDIHHWYPDSNYGQYTMLWDWLFGSFKPYPNDGIDAVPPEQAMSKKMG